MTKKRKHHRGVRFLLGLMIFLTLISLAGFTFLSHRHLDVVWEAADLSPSNEALHNPYCGWYYTYDYSVTDETSFDSETVAKEQKADNTTRLCLLCFDLGAYREGSISDHGLAEIQALLSSWASTDKQLMLCFCYGFEDSASLKEPSELSTVYLHMEQLAPVIDQYAHRIYALVGCFAGVRGSGAESSLVSADEFPTLQQYLASLTKGSIPMTAWGVPQYHLLLSENDDAFMQRFGIFDDSLTGSMSPEELKRFALTSQLQPVGGAIGADSSLYEAAAALPLLQQLHPSCLSAQENAAVLEHWKNTTYRDDTVFSGVTLYDYVTTHLGYRYVLESSSLSFDTWQSETASLTVALNNTGFANCCHTFDTSILLRHNKTEEILTFPLNTDNRLWNPGESTKLQTELDVRDYASGEYTAYLIMIDAATGEVISLGNTTPLTSYGYEIGTLKIN